MARIFVSYRRQDSAGHAGRLYDRLRAFFGASRVFMDVEGIDPGTDFTHVLEERIAGTEVVVAVIGPNWISASGLDGRRRLESEDDYVRHELATALGQHIEVIPVLVAGARVPRVDELPDDLADLVQRQMYVISDTGFDAGMERLIKGVERSAARTREMRRLAPRPKSDFTSRRWARLFLLYEPARPLTWILHILSFYILVTAILAPILVWSTGGGGSDAATLAFTAVGGLVFLLMVLRGTVLLLEPDRVVSPLRRWLLLYNPPRATMGAVHLLFVLMALVCVMLPPGLAQEIRQADDDVTRASFVEAWIVLVVMTFVVREIGAANDPLRSRLTEPSWFARLFSIWKPRRAVAWLPRVFYYVMCVLLLVAVPLLFVDADRNFASPNVTQNRGMFAIMILLIAITVSARGSAAAVEIAWPGRRPQGPLERAKSMLLLYKPWRRAGWVAAALFWLATVSLLALSTMRDATMALLDMNADGALVLMVLTALLIVVAWSWAQLYRPSSESHEPPVQQA